MAAPSPHVVLDAASANITALRSNTCFWLEDGTFLAYEGCFDDAGCCSGSCTHVWNYEQTLAYLFPTLERSMRETEFRYETAADGEMNFRVRNAFPGTINSDTIDPASDGQLGSITRVYREWKLSGDTAWMTGYGHRSNSAWSIASGLGTPTRTASRTGASTTLTTSSSTVPIHSQASSTSPLYRAATKMAEATGDYEAAERYSRILAKGSRKLDKTLWNGEYYEQRLPDVDAYKYQHGVGCLADQLFGQLNAHLSGLGYLLPPKKVKKAMGAVFKHNLLTDFTHHDNCQRTYALNDDVGLLACTWPNGGRPRIPFPYSHEVWTGIEYQVAAHLIWEGLIDEGLAITKAIRDRHDGVKRNPWNEFECGHHYARSMASWGLILALSGYQCDMTEKKISFSPRINEDDFRCFWSTGTAWGTYTQKRDAKGKFTHGVEVIHGTLKGVKVNGAPQQPI